MFRLSANLAVYLHRDAIDFRKSINGLAAIVEHDLGRDPFASAYRSGATTLLGGAHLKTSGRGRI